VAYIVFNRPAHTEQTFDRIRSARPRELFVIADGPRPAHPADVELCARVREIVEAVDWPCQVHRHYAETNMGAQQRVGTGLDWVFSQVESAIILEDDCLAHPDFFQFCDALLTRYRDDDRVWVIGGNSYQPEFQRGDGSYYFARYPDTWGWATWRRAWRHYRSDLGYVRDWQRSPHWRRCFPTRIERRYHAEMFRATIAREVDAWDFPWIAAVLYHEGLAATPNANLVENIGFDAEATHTKKRQPRFHYRATALPEIRHPTEVRADADADQHFSKLFHRNVGLTRRLGRLRRKLATLLAG